MAKKTKSTTWLIISLIVVAASWYYQTIGQGNKQLNTAVLSTVVSQAVDYEVLENCTLVNNRRNDGDSFFVKHAEGETEFRLYYVDCPESRYREYSNGDTNGKRIKSQGQYFGNLDRDTTTELGLAAKSFVRDLLKKQNFTVITKWENVFSPQRRYAFVVVQYQGKLVYLHELLVEKGLARIHTKPATMPNGRSSRDQLKILKGLEASAKSAGLGGWSE